MGMRRWAFKAFGQLEMAYKAFRFIVKVKL